MGDPREYSEFSEKTEPFSQSEIEARMLSSRMEAFSNATVSTVPLDHLVVPPDEGIRILVRPLTRSRSVSPGNQDNCRWLALHAEVADNEQSQHKVLAVTQTSRDIKFSVRIPGERLEDASPRPPLWCELYYDPTSDNQILLNRSDVPFTLSRASLRAVGSPGEEYEVRPGFNKALNPGTWRIKFNEFEVLDFRILEKRPARLRLPSNSSSDVSSEMVSSSGKRSFVTDEDDALLSPERKKRSLSTTSKEEDGVIMFLPAQTNPLVFPLPTADKGKELVTSNGHPLLDMQPEETVEIAGGCELDEYTITKKEPIASTSLSSVFTAGYSKVPDGVIVVKVLKTRSPALANNGAAEARNVIHQADVWLRELQYQEDLQHRSIVRLYGGDARFLSLYMEHVDARDLSSRGTWRSPSTELFAGDRSDALRILRDISSALHYIHNRGLIHNDIKPANILYSRERGAVLCDLGLSTHARDPPSVGGTPWYVPPEFIIMKQRGPPSDVWALGVTMLYVLGKIGFPEARGNRAHPKHIHWLIAKVHQHPRDRNPQPEAAIHMRQWLSEMNATRAGLNTQDKLERLIHDMLAPNPNQRITMKQILAQMFSEHVAEK
ncbi:kinase-like domain-containing protein [Podospora appendiculata]|uniref:Kinase-like domain-containing protein n=1 Tax=Podospora appendiculata TaxID=314037 RepID=A0AAE0XHC6_9PEZI|nr:kinase-like domain-containing protein [Podospora appendiculata]